MIDEEIRSLKKYKRFCACSIRKDKFRFHLNTLGGYLPEIRSATRLVDPLHFGIFSAATPKHRKQANAYIIFFSKANNLKEIRFFKSKIKSFFSFALMKSITFEFVSHCTLLLLDEIKWTKQALLCLHKVIISKTTTLKTLKIRLGQSLLPVGGSFLLGSALKDNEINFEFKFCCFFESFDERSSRDEFKNEKKEYFNKFRRSFYILSKFDVLQSYPESSTSFNAKVEEPRFIYLRQFLQIMSVSNHRNMKFPPFLYLYDLQSAKVLLS